jgi:hypothetical protein
LGIKGSAKFPEFIGKFPRSRGASHFYACLWIGL